MINTVVFEGRLTADPELRYTPAGQAVLTLGLACNRVFKSKDGETTEDVDFVDVECWAALAESCAQHLRRGRRVLVEGSLRLNRWDQDGQKRSKVYIQGRRVNFLDAPPDGEGRERSAAASEPRVPF